MYYYTTFRSDTVFKWIPYIWSQDVSGLALHTNGMEISAEKTKLMTNNTSGINTEIKVNGQKLETATRSRAPRKNTSHGNEVLPQDPTRLIQRPCYQRGSLCQDPAGNWTTRRPDDREETQTAVVWSCLPFIRSGQNHLARHSERGKKPRQTEEEVGRQHQGMDRPGVRKSQRTVENRGKWRKLVGKSFVVP